MPVQHLGVGTCSEERSPTLRQRGGALTYGPGNGDRRDRHPWAAAAAAASAVGRVGGGRWGWGALGAAGGPRATLWLLMTATNGADDWQSAPAVGGTPAAATRSLPPWGGGGGACTADKRRREIWAAATPHAQSSHRGRRRRRSRRPGGGWSPDSFPSGRGQEAPLPASSWVVFSSRWRQNSQRRCLGGPPRPPPRPSPQPLAARLGTVTASAAARPAGWWACLADGGECTVPGGREPPTASLP